jgi:thiol-disulfide isomerase/thioredoxin
MFTKVLMRSQLLLGLILVCAGCSGVSSAAKEMIGQPAPYTRLYMLDGTEIPLEAERGKNLMMMFWATWCGHSKGAIEDFEALAHKYHRRQDVSFIAVSIDKAEDFEALKGRIESQGLKEITHAFSGNDVQDEAYQSFHGEVLPYVIAIDPQGVVKVVDTKVSSLESYLDAKFGG